LVLDGVKLLAKAIAICCIRRWTGDHISSGGPETASEPGGSIPSEASAASSIEASTAPDAPSSASCSSSKSAASPTSTGHRAGTCRSGSVASWHDDPPSVPVGVAGHPAAGAPFYAHMHRNARGRLLARFAEQLYTDDMPRPKKPRFCRRFAGFNLFKPAGIPLSQTDVVEIGLDELEAVALCDYEGLHQEQAAEAMDVSRGTVQRLLQTGRRTIADAIVHGKALAIEESEHVHIREDVRPGRGRGRGRGNGRGKQPRGARD